MRRFFVLSEKSLFVLCERVFLYCVRILLKILLFVLCEKGLQEVVRGLFLYNLLAC